MKINIKIRWDLSYPSIAVIPFPKGLVTKDQLEEMWQLIENGLPCPSYKEVVSFWPDQTVKWIHVHSIFKGGKEYEFIKTRRRVLSSFLPIDPDSKVNWEVQVEDDKGYIWKNTKEDRNSLQTIPDDAYKLSLFDNTGGWRYNDSEDTKYVELNNSVLRITRYEGWLRNNQIKSVYKYCTRVTKYSGSPLCKISHSIIFAGNMKGRRIKHISFLLKSKLETGGQCETGVDGASHQFDLNNSRGQVLIHQKAIDHCEFSGPGVSLQTKGKSDGYIRKGSTSLFVRDFWQKFPQAFECNKINLTYRQWYGGETPFFDDIVGTEKRRLLDTNIHKLLHWHQGPFLANDIPKTNDPQNPEWADKFYGLMLKDEGGVGEYIEYTDNADMQGITIHDELAIYTGDVNTALYANLWNDNPVGYCDPAYIESTAVVDFAAKGNDFNKVEEFMEGSIISYTNPNRFEDYGRFIYGDSHRNILPYFNRPSFHRLFLASYYCAGEIYWRMRLRGGSNNILELARRNTERYRSVVQVSYDEREGGDRDNDSEINWHDPGSFWYRGLWWGNVRGGQPPHATDQSSWTSNWGRVPDPDSLRWSWILDGNRYHKEGYELWYHFAKKSVIQGSVTPDNAREFNKTIVYAINAYDHFLKYPATGFTDTLVTDSAGRNEMDLKKYILSWANMLLNLPLSQIRVGPIWQPEWLKTLAEFLNTYYTAGPGEQPKEAFISKVLQFAVSNYRSNFYSNSGTLDMASLLVDINRNEKYPFYYEHFPAEVTPDDIKLSDHLFWISKIMDAVYKGIDPTLMKWQNFGIGDGELGDHYLKLQWGAFLKRLRQLNIDDSLTNQYNFHGHYPTSSQSMRPFHPYTLKLCYGNEYLIFKDNAAPLDLAFKFAMAGMGTRGGFNREIWLITPAKHKENLVRLYGDNNLYKPNIIPTGTKFIPVIGTKNLPGGAAVTSDNYAEVYRSTGIGYVRRPLDYYTRPQNSDDRDNRDYSFDTYAPPHIVDETVMVYSWDHGQNIRSATGNENYTVTDTCFAINIPGLPVSEQVIYRAFIGGSSIYPGLTSTQLPEVMILRPIKIDGIIINYRFLNSNLYFKNIDNTEVTLQFTASVEEAINDTKVRILYGSFVRICIWKMNRPQTFDLPYRGNEYGQPLPDEIINVTLLPGEIIQVKTTMIYSYNNCIMMTFDGLLLCGKSKGDILAFEPYSAELKENYYGL